MRIQRIIHGAPRALILALTALAAITATTVSAHAATPVQVSAKADPGVRDAEAESGSDHDPYVAFAIKGADKAARYRLVVEESPTSKKDRPCNPGLTTSFTPVLPSVAGGHVVFDLEPVSSGRYFPFAGYEPCRGKYVIAVQAQPRTGRFHRVRTFAFWYPSLKISYLASGEGGS